MKQNNLVPAEYKDKECISILVLGQVIEYHHYYTDTAIQIIIYYPRREGVPNALFSTKPIHTIMHVNP